MSIEPGSLGRPTERDIEAAWKAVEKPSIRTVGAAMRAAGWDISISTIQRVAKKGFRPGSRDGRGKKGNKSGVRKAREAANPTEGLSPDDTLLQAFQSLPPGAKDRVKELLDLDDQEIENRASKLVKVARLLLAEDLAQHTKLMMLAPDKAAKLYQALGTGLVPIVQPPMPGAGADAKVIDHNPNEPRQLSASAQAIADFRARRGSVAA